MEAPGRTLGQAGPEGLDRSSDVVHELRASTNQRLARADDGHMGLGVFAPMLERVQELRIKTRQASQVLGVYLTRLALVGIDEPQFAGIGHQHLVAAFLEHPAHPRRVSTRLNCDAHGLLRTETPPQSLRSGTQPTFLHNLTALLIDETEVGVLVAEVQPGCDLRLPFATSLMGRSSFLGR